jgi:hypothetical protein
MLSGAPLSFMLTWLTTALLYIPLQTVLFGVLDLSGWHQPLRSLWFWLLIGCYTSAIMLTEVAIGPPPVGLSDLTDLVAVRAPSHFVSDMYHWSWESAICWAQMSVWLIGLMSCYLVRLRRERRQPALVLLATLVTALATLVLYSTAVEHIGGRLDGLFN